VILKESLQHHSLARIGAKGKDMRHKGGKPQKLPERACYPGAGCSENCKSGFEREDWEATPSSTPTRLPGRVSWETGLAVGDRVSGRSEK